MWCPQGTGKAPVSGDHSERSRQDQWLCRRRFLPYRSTSSFAMYEVNLCRGECFVAMKHFGLKQDGLIRVRGNYTTVAIGSAHLPRLFGTPVMEPCGLYPECRSFHCARTSSSTNEDSVEVGSSSASRVVCTDLGASVGISSTQRGSDRPVGRNWLLRDHR